MVRSMDDDGGAEADADADADADEEDEAEVDDDRDVEDDDDDVDAGVDEDGCGCDTVDPIDDLCVALVLVGAADDDADDDDAKQCTMWRRSSAPISAVRASMHAATVTEASNEEEAEEETETEEDRPREGDMASACARKQIQIICTVKNGKLREHLKADGAITHCTKQ